MLPHSKQAYSIGGGNNKIGGGNNKPFNLSDAALVRGLTSKMVGENLFETLMLNLVR